MVHRVRKQKREGLLLLFIILSVVIAVLCVTIKVNASQDDNKRIQVKSVLIESGDSLWGIAMENYSEDYESIEDYVDAIKECNHITTDKICTGSYLIVPYYQ